MEINKMKLDIFQVDAFSQDVFGGNPAAVIPLQKWLPDALLQSIAAENNLSETAFFVATKDLSDANTGAVIDTPQADYELRWFTPSFEVDLCGHATLASAYVLFEELEWNKGQIVFSTRKAGLLTVVKSAQGISLNFPARPALEKKAPEALLAALGVDARQLSFSGLSRDWLLVLESQQQVEAVAPDFSALAPLHDYGVIVTAPGDKHDFVSRFFIPVHGINEDPVTGSAHCTLVPYWAQRLDKNSLTAKQVSARGGELNCELITENEEGRVLMSGEAVLYLKGQITV